MNVCWDAHDSEKMLTLDNPHYPLSTVFSRSTFHRRNSPSENFCLCFVNFAVTGTLFLGRNAAVEILNINLYFLKQHGCHEAPLYLGGDRILRDGYLKTHANETKTICLLDTTGGK